MPMPRFSLRTLLILTLLTGPLCALGWQVAAPWRAKSERNRIRYRLYLRSVGLNPGDIVTTTCDAAARKAATSPPPSAAELAERKRCLHLLMQMLREDGVINKD
jgi:hypothetical protein